MLPAPAPAEALKQIKRVGELIFMVELLLNQTKPEHSEFVKRLQSAKKFLYFPTGAEDDPTVARDNSGFLPVLGDLLARPKGILKVEWERVKAGEPLTGT